MPATPKQTYADEDMLLVGDAADYLEVAQSTVRRWADSGHLPSVRTPGNLRLIRFADVRKLRAELSGESLAAPRSSSSDSEAVA